MRNEVLSKEAPNIVMLQPRRVAARAAAERMAEENGWRVGEEVGYHIRFEKRYTQRTRIRVLTEAILTRMLLDDPYLEGVGCVILDEFHERSIHTDLALAFLREVQQTVRPELKVLVMSATLDAESVAGFLGGSNAGFQPACGQDARVTAPVVEVEGRVFPVEIFYRPGRDVRLEEHVSRVIEEAIGGEGDVLVFLPGVGEIERVRGRLGQLEREGFSVLALHGSLSSEEQQRTLRADEKGRRKVILATNIAETSLTIDGVRVVVDSGLARVASFDASRGMDRLDLERISQASAAQRAGRAARQGPGVVYRLWGELEQKHLAAFNVPEVERVDLAATVLAVHAWGAKNAREFGWFEQPSEERIAAAEGLLGMLGGLAKTQNAKHKTQNPGLSAGVDGGVDGGWELTEIGRGMMRVPVHPRVGRMLMAAKGTGLEAEAVNLAAVLSDDSRSAVGDIFLRAERLPAHLSRTRDQLASINRTIKTTEDTEGTEATDGSRTNSTVSVSSVVHSRPHSLEELLLLAYPDRVSRRRGGADPLSAVMVGGGGVRLTPEALTPALSRAELFLALDPHHDPRNKRAEAMVRTAVAVSRESLERLFPEQMRTETVLEYDAGKEKVAAFTRRYFHDLVLEEDPHGRVDLQRAGEVLAEALLPRGRDLLMRNEAASKVMARVALVRSAMPEKAGDWPSFDDAQIAEVLRAACAGNRSLAEVVEGKALEEAVRGVLVYPMDRELERLAPETIEVPSGSRIRIEYSLPAGDGAPPPAPVLAVRLQELFGWLETPRIVGGRVALLLHLLSPGYKPMQITQDLKSFWGGAYFEVRKDLRVRYPKHKWPEDPLTAAPEAKGRARK